MLALYLLHQSFKTGGVVFGEGGEGFAVEFNFFKFQEMDKSAVREAEGRDGGADFDVPEAAEVVLLIASAHEGVDTSFKHGGSSLALFFAGAMTVALSGC